MSSKKVLILGSGMVAKPCVKYLLRDPRNHLTIACRGLAAAEQLADQHPRTKAINLDVTSEALEEVIAEHHLIVSLVPFVHHTTIIKTAIRHKRDVVTTSYISPEIRAFEAAIKDAGVVIVNEVGVDPGIDHLYAVKTIAEVHSKGGKVKEFHSYCGGLPAPEASNNPLRFKFSWSPRGALLSQQNSATFLQNGQEITIPSQDLMASAQPYDVVEGYSFLAFANCNSVPFREYYQIPEADTVVRGSLRYKGNPELVRALMTLGWLDPSSKTWLVPPLSWAKIQMRITGAPTSSERDLVGKVDELCSFPYAEERRSVLDGLRWIGLFSDEDAPVQASLLDTLSVRLQALCSFEPGERDLVMLQHKFMVEWPNGEKNTMTSTLELLGDPNGDFAMSKSVGITCGIATQMLLDRHPAIHRPGIVAPYTLELCEAMRVRVEAEGIKCVERTF